MECANHTQMNNFGIQVKDNCISSVSLGKKRASISSEAVPFLRNHSPPRWFVSVGNLRLEFMAGVFLKIKPGNNLSPLGIRDTS